MTEFKIKPASGALVRDPLTNQPLADNGEIKPRNSYWLRRLNDGDVEIVTASKKGDSK